MFRVKGRSFCLRNAVDAERFDLPEIRDRGPLRVGMVSSKALAMLDVVLGLTRVGESCGRSVAEAMASRRLVIAYARGAMPELVVHDRTGFLVPAGDLQAVLLCLCGLEEDRLRAREMGRAGRRRMQEAFSVAGFERSLDAIYRRILATSSASGAGHGKPGSRRGLSA